MATKRACTEGMNYLQLAAEVEEDIDVGQCFICSSKVGLLDGQDFGQLILVKDLKGIIDISGQSEESVDDDRVQVCYLCHKDLQEIESLKLLLFSKQEKVRQKFEQAFKLELPAKMALKSSQETADKVNFKCDTCDKGFTRKASMLEHMARHQGTKEKECQVLYRVYTQCKNEGFFSFFMQICQKRFYPTAYWRHMSSVHASQEKLVHQCQLCDKKFPHQFRLRLHQQSHLTHDQVSSPSEILLNNRVIS
jgi:hypothetical protein